MHSALVTLCVLLFVATLVVNAMISDRMMNEVNDAHAGPYISPFERGWRRGSAWSRGRAYSLIEERHAQLFPQSRLRLVEKFVRYGLVAVWLGFVAFTVWIDSSGATEHPKTAQSLSR